MKQAIILAGGKGTRLSHVVTDTQKVMAPISGRPFLCYVLDSLISKGFNSFILAVGYKSEQLCSFFGSSYRGAEIIYSVEHSPLGTGGAIKKAFSMCRESAAAVINGDTFFDANFTQLFDFHKKSGADITVAAKKMCNFSRYGTIDCDESGRICAFREKKYCDSGLINAGVYIVNKSLMSKIEKDSFSFEKELLETLSCKLYAEESDGFFIDIGVPEDYFSAAVSVPMLFGENCFKAVFLDRDGVICRERHHLYKKSDFEFIPGTCEAIELLREKGYLAVVITNQAGVAKGLYTEDDVRALHDYMLALIRDKAKIDAVYYCPYHKEAVIERYRADSYDRKPKPGMIERAVRDFAAQGIKIDLSNSIIIGDTERDIETGINAGIGTKVLVRSGHKIADETASRADIICGSLYDFALNFLT